MTITPVRIRPIRPVELEAVQFTDENMGSLIAEWCGGSNELAPNLIQFRDGSGPVTAVLGDWIVRGVTGTFFVRRPHDFDETYEPATYDDEWEPVPDVNTFTETNTFTPLNIRQALRTADPSEQVIAALGGIAVVGGIPAMLAGTVINLAGDSADLDVFVSAAAVLAGIWLLRSVYWRARARAAEHHITEGEN
ncbi:hypothetical protein IU459_11940 [Nocardia amamiensis]|uniref:Uncharacterized protein n=1 Tax=Nocardia amamiensis TaxID=404578 RepID=A0ABS0CNU9_9NOCA|nr:hypothetical protein [Nocardia amamiensis]MBF6298252.1 hypothetical protein [Nocardia amamiensis]